jgi:hypothetical protein
MTQLTHFSETGLPVVQLALITMNCTSSLEEGHL